MGASQPAILSNIKPFRGCPHITAAAGGEGFVNADVSRGEGKSIIILPDIIVCGQLQNRDLLRTYVCFNWNFSLNETFSRICCQVDLSNAFNCLNRSYMLAEVARLLPECLPWVLWLLLLPPVWHSHTFQFFGCSTRQSYGCDPLCSCTSPSYPDHCC